MIHPEPPEAFLDFLRAHSLYFVVGHKEPDGDCLSSQVALAGILKGLGKVAYLCSSGPFTRPEVASMENMFQDCVPEELKSRDAAAIVVDCSSLSRTGDLERQLAGLPVAFIDHHSAADIQGPANYVDVKAPSVTFMVRKLYPALGLGLPADAAELLLFGLCTDTGFFRHLDARGGDALRCAADLADAGASPKASFQRIYGGKSLNSRKLLGIILSRAEEHFGGRLLVSHETLDDSERFGLESRDSDMLYQILQGVAGYEALMVIRQETPVNCTVGFRSRDRIDVAKIAAAFGGGGHKNAAGLSIPGTIETVKEKLLTALSPEFS